MDAQKLQLLIQQPEPESLKLDFKRKFHEVNHSDRKVRDMHWNELIKDILALANGNVGTADQEGYLIIGVSDKPNTQGTRDLYDVGNIDVTDKDISEKVNGVCRPKLPDLHSEIIELEGKRIFVLIIPPTPYLYEIIRSITTEKTTYHENTVFIRRKEDIGIASTEERQAIQADKRAKFSLSAAGNFDNSAVHLTDDLINEHRRRLAEKPHYARWADRSSDESYISSTGIHLPIFASPYESTSGRPELLVQSIRLHHHLLILGEPGMGKTVTLERVMWEFATDSAGIIPIYVPLIQYSNNLPADIMVALNETAVLDIANVSDLEKVLRQYKCILLFDGLNEVAGGSREKLYEELAVFLRTHPSCPCIITSRSQDDLWRRFHSREMIEDAVVVRRIEEEQVLEYLKAHLGDEQGREFFARFNEPLRELAQIPLLLWLIKEACKAGEELPGNRGALFERFVEKVLAREKKTPDIMIIPRSQKIQALGHLAFRLQNDHRLACSHDEAIRIIKSSYKDVEATSVVEEALQNGLLTGEKQLHFMHQTLLEYFVAVRLRELICVMQIPDRNMMDNVKNYMTGSTFKKRFKGWAKDERWAEVFVHLAGITEDPNFVAKQVLSSNSWLAYWCAIEGQALDQALHNQIELQTVRKLESAKSEERLHVIRELARMENPRTIQFLILALSDSTTTVCELAQQTLIELGEPTVKPLLNCLVGADERFRQVATRTISEIWGIPVLTKLGDADIQIRCEAAKALGHIKDERILPLLFAALEDSSQDVRFEVIQSLGKLGDPKAIDPLMQALERTYKQSHSEESPIIAQALASLGESTERSLLDGLKEFDDSIRTQALVAIGSTWNKPEIVELTDPDPIQRVLAVKKLTRLLDMHHIEPILLAALKDHDRSVRWEAIISLGHIFEDPTMIELANENPYMRESAVQALGMRSTPLIIELLITTFRDPDSNVKASAAKAFENQDESAIEYLLPLLHQTNRELRQIAGLALSNMKCDEVVNVLIIAMQDTRPIVREAAIDPLVKVGDRAVDFLEKLLLADNTTVRDLARVVLKRIGTVKAQGALHFKGGDHLLSQIINKLQRVFLRDDGMDAALCERELVSHVEYWRNDLKQNQDEILFVVTGNADNTAMVLFTRKGEIYKNEAALEKLRKIWAEIYEEQIGSLMRSMAKKLADGVPFVYHMEKW